MSIAMCEQLEPRLCLSGGGGFSLVISVGSHTSIHVGSRHQARHHRRHRPRLVALGGGIAGLGVVDSRPATPPPGGIFSTAGFGSIGVGLPRPGLALPNPVGGLGAFR